MGLLGHAYWRLDLSVHQHMNCLLGESLSRPLSFPEDIEEYVLDHVVPLHISQFHDPKALVL